MAKDSSEPICAMGDDTPLAVLSNMPQRFFNYFKQKFAQVTNPPIDPIRESSVMSLTSYIGAVKGDILKPSAELCKVVKLSSPILSNLELTTLKNLKYKGFRTITLPMLFKVKGGSKALEMAIEELCQSAEKAEVLSLIKQHHKYTGSKLAARIALDWEERSKEFIVVRAAAS